MTKDALMDKVCEKLGLTEGDRKKIDMNDALPVLQELARDMQRSQRAMGFILWNMDPSPQELRKIAEMLNLGVETLRSWMNTYSRLRESHALLSFSMQQQLARIQDKDEREELFTSRPESEWTLRTLTEAVEDWIAQHVTDGMPRSKKAGCRAKFGDRQVKVNLELLQDAVIVKLTVSEGTELTDMKSEQLSAGVYQVKFDW